MRAVSGCRGCACVPLAHALLLGWREAPLLGPSVPSLPGRRPLQGGLKWRQLPVPSSLTSQHAFPQDVNPRVPEAPNPVEQSAWPGRRRRRHLLSGARASEDDWAQAGGPLCACALVAGPAGCDAHPDRTALAPTAPG